MYQWLIKPILFLLPPEQAHHFSLTILRWLLYMPGAKMLTQRWFSAVDNPVSLFGLTFKNAVGLAAGFDKDGKYLDLMPLFGFGFIEIGTVTPLPQGGNPRPRLFRLPQDTALINRMGFNNEGVDSLVERLRAFDKGDLIIGGNIGKNKMTPNDKAVEDYAICFEKLFDYVDYFVVNVSSPNTPGLRELQEKEPLTALLQHLQKLNHQHPQPKPLLLKIAPDLTESQLDDIIDIVKETELAGIIATNTTVAREPLKTNPDHIKAIGAGGLSGFPVTSHTNQILTWWQAKAPEIPLIGVGGITSEAEALNKKALGASLIQIYTGFIYQGPGFVKRLINAWSRPQ